MSSSVVPVMSSTVTPAADDTSSDRILFSVWDYVVFIGVLVISALIGVWYAFRGGKQQSNDEFLLGDRKMSVLPVALSLIASFISAISITGLSSEWYTRGMQFLLASFGGMLAMIIVAYYFLPVYYPLQLISVYEYLEMRYDKRIMRILGNFLSTIQTILYMAVVLYAPALAINAVTNFPIYYSILLVGGVCTFYTAIGGLKAVIWTDVFQSIVMYTALFTVIIWGSIHVGGVGEVWRIAHKYGRTTSFNVSADPTEYQTVWGIFFSGLYVWLGAYGVSQQAIQRYCSMPTMAKARKALFVNMPGFVIIGFLCGWCGFTIFATYEGCDPLAAGIIKRKDQVLPYFVIDKLHVYPGIPGLFVASIFSGSLSSVSSGVNSLAAIMWEDILKNWLQHKGDKFAANCCKVIALLYGIISIGFAFVVSNLGGVLQTSLMLLGCIGGPKLGLFILSIFFTSTNWIGALSGTLISLAFMLWISVGRMSNIRHLTPPYLPSTGTDKCSNIPYNLINMTWTTPASTPVIIPHVTTSINNVTTVINSLAGVANINPVFYISYLWYPLMGLILCVIIGIAVSHAVACIFPRLCEHKPGSHLVYPLVDIIHCRCRASAKPDRELTISSPQAVYHLEDDSSEDEYDERLVKLNTYPNTSALVSPDKPPPYTEL